VSYARFGDADEPDVYVFENGPECGDKLVCCACAFSDEFSGDATSVVTQSTELMLLHLLRHKLAGHAVPDRVFRAVALRNQRGFPPYDRFHGFRFGD